MPGQQQKPQGPDASSTLGAIGDLAGAAGSIFGLDGIGGAISGIGNGLGGAGKEVTGDSPNPFGFMGGVSNLMSGIYSIPGVSAADDIMGDVFGGMGNAFGIITGIQDAADGKKSTADRVVGGIDAGANALSLGGTLGGAGLTGAGVGGASTLATSGAGAALTAGGATTLAAGGAVLGAGVAGYKIGGLINSIADSKYGVGPDGQGTDDRWQQSIIDDAIANGEDPLSTWNIVKGTAAGTVGQIADAGRAVGGWVSSWFD